MKHFKRNKKTNLINIIALSLSFFSILVVLNSMNSKTSIASNIKTSYINNEYYSISKIKDANASSSDISIIQYSRPTVKEVSNISYFNDCRIYYDLTYLLDTYELKVDDYTKNITVSFEPHFRNDNTFYFSNIEGEKIDLIFKKEIEIITEESNYELFEFDTRSYEFKKFESFNFLNLPTIYYPYSLVYEKANNSFILSTDESWYQYIVNSSNSSIASNYSLIINIANESKLIDFNKSKFSSLYQVSNTAIEIRDNFMSLFSSILDFVLYFLIIIIVLVIVLLIYSLYFNIIKNHKEIALIKSYGMSDGNLKLVHAVEINIILLISIFSGLILNLLVNSVINFIWNLIFKVPGSFGFNVSSNFLVILICILVTNLLIHIPLFFLNKVSIRKELNSI